MYWLSHLINNLASLPSTTVYNCLESLLVMVTVHPLLINLHIPVLHCLSGANNEIFVVLQPMRTAPLILYFSGIAVLDYCGMQISRSIQRWFLEPRTRYHILARAPDQQHGTSRRCCCFQAHRVVRDVRHPLTPEQGDSPYSMSSTVHHDQMIFS
jgi:hypothetical protein